MAIHAKERQITALERPNFAGLSQALTPVIFRESKIIANRQAARSNIIVMPTKVSEGLVTHSDASQR
jgi:hypothetical protein